MSSLLISREDAKHAKLTRFYTGKPCGKGHRSERYVSTGVCVACVGVRSEADLEKQAEETDLFNLMMKV